MTTEHRISDRTIAMHCCRAYALLLLCAATAIASPARTFTSLLSFDGTDGSYPGFWALVQTTNGNLYGTTYQGGASFHGTIFKITPSGRLTTLHSFDGTDGAYPLSGLIQATNGDFYGTTYLGGANGQGTVYKISSSGTLTTLYSFCSQIPCTDGDAPFGGLVQAAVGDLYGTTQGGGGHNCSAGCGTVFKITPSGTLTTLYSFCSQSNCTDGAGPMGALVQATDGNLNGTTTVGGDMAGVGTVFKITLGGKLTTLHIFGTDGAYPYPGLVQATNGTFYGTTEEGGAYYLGTIFSLSVNLGPFVQLQDTSGKVGATVKILRTDLTGATGVTFNGTAAKFKVASPSLIKTTVPEGATTPGDRRNLYLSLKCGTIWKLQFQTLVQRPARALRSTPEIWSDASGRNRRMLTSEVFHHPDVAIHSPVQHCKMAAVGRRHTVGANAAPLRPQGASVAF